MDLILCKHIVNRQVSFVYMDITVVGPKRRHMCAVSGAETSNGNFTADKLLVSCSHRRQLQYRTTTLGFYRANLDEVARQFHIKTGAAACLCLYRIHAGCSRIVFHTQYHGLAFRQVQEEIPIGQRHMGRAGGNNVVPIDRTLACAGNSRIARNIDIPIQ